MESYASQIIFNNWKLKIFAFIAAVAVWFFVNNTITEVATIRNVPVRVVNLPPKKTIFGLRPNGYLGNRMTLTLTGTKKVIDELEAGDLEVLLEGPPSDLDEWNVKIEKDNLISLNPSVNLSHHIHSINHPELIIKLSSMETEKIPIQITPPIGSSPQGYEFLDIWPQQLLQSVVGSKEEIDALKIYGLQFAIDLNQIKLEELENLKGSQDEISYLVPNSWKKVLSVKGHYPVSEINDPEAKQLRINFLKNNFLPIEREVSIIVHYPIKNSSIINPHTYPLELGPFIDELNGIKVYAKPLYIKNISRLFLDLIRDNLQIVIEASPTSEQKILSWSLQVIHAKILEDLFVENYLLEMSGGKKSSPGFIAQNEPHLRKRFRDYLQNLNLYNADGSLLNLIPQIIDEKIVVN